MIVANIISFRLWFPFTRHTMVVPGKTPLYDRNYCVFVSSLSNKTKRPQGHSIHNFGYLLVDSLFRNLKYQNYEAKIRRSPVEKFYLYDCTCPRNKDSSICAVSPGHSHIAWRLSTNQQRSVLERPVREDTCSKINYF